ncbi:MAG TPA: hypothetical protein ENH82_13380 [bacterium]|nr:hypothetical protein [bacterium]
MNIEESDSSAAILNIAVDGDTTFKRTITYKENDIPVDTTYFEGEFVVFYPQTCKQIYIWSTANGKLVYSDTGKYDINQFIDVADDVIDKGDYEYYFLLKDGDGVILKYLRGKFIIK